MLKHAYLKNKSIATSYGLLEFDANGENRQLSEEQEKRLGELNYYTYVDETPKEETEDEDHTEEDKEEPENEDTLQTMYEGMLEGNVDAVKEKTKNIDLDTVTELIHIEKANKNRKGVINHLEEKFIQDM
jgi:hypothetical protein